MEVVEMMETLSVYLVKEALEIWARVALKK
jgi:hypothetical protein